MHAMRNVPSRKPEKVYAWPQLASMLRGEGQVQADCVRQQELVTLVLTSQSTEAQHAQRHHKAKTFTKHSTLPPNLVSFSFSVRIFPHFQRHAEYITLTFRVGLLQAEDGQLRHALRGQQQLPVPAAAAHHVHRAAAARNTPVSCYSDRSGIPSPVQISACDALTLPRARGGGCNPPISFLEWSPNRWADRTKILHSLWGTLCATFGKK